MTDELRDAIQRLLDEAGDGWTVTQFVVAMGLVRITSDGRLEAIPWHWAPPDQPDWQTVGLLNEAVDRLESADYDDD